MKPARRPSAVERVDQPRWVRSAKTGSRREGVRFERREQEKLVEEFGPKVECNPWFRFMDGGERFCSPDAIIWVERPIVVEFKTAHCEKAWWQLHKLYIPVLDALEPEREFRAVEVCRVFRPEVEFPGAIQMIARVAKAPRTGTGIYVVNGLL